jgi:hypothetical protein
VDPKNFSAVAAAFWRWVAANVSPYIPPKRPGSYSARLVREESNMLVYGLQLPADTASDIVSRELTVSVEGSDPVVVEATETTEFSAPDNALVNLSLVFVDDAGNRSEATTFEFTALDTIAPPAPGEFGVALLREE